MIRPLTPADAQALDGLLRAHADSSLILRSNVRAVGLGYSGQSFEAQYVASFDGETMRGVVGHGWNGILLLQAPHDVEALVVAALANSGRALKGLIGPWPQVMRARAALRLGDDRFRLAEEETLMSMAVKDVRGDGAGVRLATLSDVDVLSPWRVAYEREALFNDAPDAGALRAGLVRSLEANAGTWFVLEEGGVVQSMGLFTARLLPEAVQLGSIYTPPELRSRGCARRLVAGMLRASGAERAILFTKNPAALRSYAAVGFAECGTFGLALLR